MAEVIWGSIFSAMGTSLGALPILFFRKMTHRVRDILLAFTAGVMVSASLFGLIPEALKNSNVWVLTIGVLIGSSILALLERYLPHIDIESNHKRINIDEKALLIIAALTLHNLPEGMSVGVSYASVNQDLGSVVALSIGLQNAPEGLIVGLFLIQQNISRFKAFLLATLTGCVEIVASLLGYYGASQISGLVPYGLSFAAGAMLFIVYKELIPESFNSTDGNETTSTFSFIIGLLSMIWIMEIFQ